MNSTSMIFSTTTEIVRVDAGAVTHVTADGNYSVLHLVDGGEYTLAIQLGQIERRMLELLPPGDNRFIRIGKSLIINRHYITFINITRQRLVLSDLRTFRYEVSPSREALKALKELIEHEQYEQ